MNKKLAITALALGLGLGSVNAIPTNLCIETAYAAKSEIKASDIDTKPLEFQVAAAKYLLKNFPNTIRGDIRAELEELVVDSEKLLERVYEFKRRSQIDKDIHIKVKNQIRQNLDKRNTEFTIKVNDYTNKQKITDYFTETAKEDWYFFYSNYDKANVSTKFNPRKKVDDLVYVDSTTFTVSYRANESTERNVEEFADIWVANNINPSESDFDKVLKIHDFIAKSNQYNRGDSQQMSGGYSIYHPASILFGNGGVCNAYATLFDKLGTKAGLDVRYATGQSKKTGEAHIWNMVKVDGVWYNIDVTWDDPTITFNEGYVENIDDYVIYEYFLKSDSQMLASRHIDQDPDRPLGIATIETGISDASIQKIDGVYKVVR